MITQGDTGDRFYVLLKGDVAVQKAYFRELAVEEVEKVKTVLLDWANNNALKEGINVSWGSKPVDYQMMVLINSILTTEQQ